MHFAIGTANRPKSAAIERVLSTAPYTAGQATFSNHRVESGVPDMPTTLSELRDGAKNRAIYTRKCPQPTTSSGWRVESTRMVSEKSIGLSESSISRIETDEDIGDIRVICESMMQSSMDSSTGRVEISSRSCTHSGERRISAIKNDRMLPGPMGYSLVLSNS